MSSRYGRNQRRRHREEIAELRQIGHFVNDLAEARKNEISDLQRRMSAWAANIRRMLGPDHPFNEEVKKRVMESLNMRPMVQVYLPDRLSLADLIPTTGSIVARDVAATTLDLICHYLIVRKFEPGGMPRAIFRLVSGDGAESSYAIDHIALIEGRRDPRFMEWLAEELVRALNRPEAKAA